MPIVKVQSSNPRYGAPRQPAPVTQRSLSHAKLQQIRSIFLLVDMDRDGKLAWDEAVHAGRLLGVRLTKQESEYEHVPKDTHLYTFDEFADIMATALFRDHNAVNEMEFLAKRVFTAIDKHKTGHVSAKDLAAFFAVCGDKKPREYAEAMMAAMDVSMEEKSITEGDLEAFLNSCASMFKSKAHKTVPMPEKPFSMYADITTQLLIRSMMSVEERLEAAENEDSDNGWSSGDEAGPERGIPEQTSEELEGFEHESEDDDEDDESASSKSSQWSSSDDASDSGGSVASSTMITRMVIGEEPSHLTSASDPSDPANDPSALLTPEQSLGSFARQASLGGTMQAFIQVKGAGHEHGEHHDEDAAAGKDGSLGGPGAGESTEGGIVPSNTLEESNHA